MNALLHELNRENVAENVVNFLNSSENCMAILHGPSGCGKSWFARTIGAIWQEAGGTTIIADGDSEKTHRDLFPLTYSLSALPKTWHATIGTRGKKIAAGLGSAFTTLASGIPVPQSVGDGLIDLLLGDAKEQLPFLTEAELQVLLSLKRFTAKKPCLLIVDDFQWWDVASRDFISFLHSDRLRSVVKQLANLRTIVVLREDEQFSDQLRQIRKIGPKTQISERLNICTQQQFPAVLTGLGLQTDLDLQTSDKLYDITCGHLKVMDRLVSHLNATGLAFRNLENTSQHGLLKLIISERLSVMEEDADDVLQVLKFASVVGKSFTKSELICLTEYKTQHIDTLLQFASAAGPISPPVRTSATIELLISKSRRGKAISALSLMKVPSELARDFASS